ncbi:MAG: response regulator transcription factor [Clostridia bacterium]|nr:response regulator transcription factor [Clostridia bacterium]MBQ9919865.1 response regulator transcription factor [Clostridia bacterium]
MIWCVDDDNTIRDIEVYTLEQTGFKARGFADGISMLEALKTEKPMLIVLDIMLPEKDGVEVLKEIKQNPETRKIPVIMATAKGTEMDKIQGLDTGADDYLVKPFGVMEMISRIKAVLRRCEPDEKEEAISIGEITLSEKEHLVTVNGERKVLTFKEFEILKLFMQSPGIVFSRDKLLWEVWGVDYLGESRTVDMHIKTLRQKLGNAGSRIETVIGVGYKMEGKK